MNEPSVAEIMPVLYRGVLDAVAELESKHGRREAARIRAEATKVYSRAWTVDAARRLRALCERASRAATIPAVRRSRYTQVLQALGRPAGLRSDIRPDMRAELERKPA